MAVNIAIGVLTDCAALILRVPDLSRVQRPAWQSCKGMPQLWLWISGRNGSLAGMAYGDAVPLRLPLLIEGLCWDPLPLILILIRLELFDELLRHDYTALIEPFLEQITSLRHLRLNCLIVFCISGSFNWSVCASYSYIPVCSALGGSILRCLYAFC